MKWIVKEQGGECGMGSSASEETVVDAAVNLGFHKM
jgi:hypothetical protein